MKLSPEAQKQWEQECREAYEFYAGLYGWDKPTVIDGGNMNDAFEKKANNAAHGQDGQGAVGSGFSHPCEGNGRNHDKDWTRKEAVALPALEEMGDIAPAMELLLRTQSEYVRREPGVSRAMRDVAYHAVAVEIERYVRMRLAR